MKSRLTSGLTVTLLAELVTLARACKLLRLKSML